jgi:hypothetical protein
MQKLGSSRIVTLQHHMTVFMLFKKALPLFLISSSLFFFTPTLIAQDTDGDGIADATDIDDDNDGILDTLEGCTDTFIPASNGSSATQITSRVETLSGAIDGVNGTFARFRDNGAQMEVVLRGGDILLAGTELTIVAQKSDSRTGNRMVVTESTDGTNYTNSQTFSFTETGVYQNKIYTLSTNATHIRITYSRSRGDLRVDNVSFASFIIPCTGIDTDNDGIPNHLDLDSDNDGILDNIEAQSTITQSLTYEFFNGAPSGNTVDNIPTTNPTATGTVSNFDVDALWTSITPGDGETFSVRWKGTITIATAGTYTFFTESDDGSSLSISGTEVVNNDFLQAATERSGTRVLAVGTYSIEVLYFELTGQEIMSVSYSGPGITKTALPFSILSSGVLCDTDQDGVPNHLDLDSDNDGIFDIIEAGGTDSNNDGVVDTTTDTDGDGWANTFDSNNGGTALIDPDTDGDGLENRIDIDSDGDGVVDLIESQATTGSPLVPIGIDTDGDGLDDAFDADNGGTSIVPVNSDGLDNPDYIDTDSDNDGLLDIIEAWDSDGNFIADTAPAGLDSDGDGLDDNFDDVVGPNATTNVYNNQDANDFPDITTSAETSERDWRESNLNLCEPGGIDTNILLWLKADQGGTAWRDISNNYVSTTAVGTPTNGSLINFNPSIALNGTSYYNTNLSINADTYADLSVIMVYQPSTDNSGAVWGEDDGNWDRFLLDTPSNNNTVGDGLGGTRNINGLYDTNAPSLASITYDNGVNNGSSVRVNGELQVNFTADHSSNSSNTFQIGALGDNSNPFNGEIAEVIVYGNLLNAGSDLNRVQSYLALKYGITLSSDTDGDATPFEDGEGDYLASDGSTIFWDASVNQAFQNNVAGIARDDLSCLNQKQSKSANSDAIVTIGLDDNQDGLEAENSINGSSFTADLSSLIWGHDGETLYDNDENIDYDRTQVNSRLNREWLVRETGTVGTITVQFDVSSILGSTGIGTNDESQIVLLVDADGDFSNGASIVSQSFVTADDDLVNFQVNFVDGTYFTLASYEENALPITLIEFNAQPKDNYVLIEWSTASEGNNSLFRIEKSMNGEDFMTLGYLDGAGTSEFTNRYNFRDKQPFLGVNYYRLVDIDNNGIENNSEIIRVNVPKVNDLESAIRVYPNAVKAGESINIILENYSASEIAFELISLEGRPILKTVKLLEEATQLQIPSNLKAGYYLLRVSGLGFSKTNRIIVN